MNDIFKNVLPADGASKWSQKCKAVLRMGQEKKVKGIAATIRLDMQALTYYHVAEGATAAQGIAPVSTEDTVAQGLFVMPYARNSRFIGRDAYIEDLSARLENRKGHNRVALVGLGGIG